MGEKMKKIWMLLALAFYACGNNQDPQLFLPKLTGPEGADLEALRVKYCQGVVLDLDNLLTPENFRSVFNCANYDSKLEDLRPLFTNQEFPDFLRNMNVILGSSNTQGLKETLRAWFEESSNGESRLDRLLPLIARVIRNPSFQDSLPLLSDILQYGREVWPMLLPGLADIVYQDRFPNTFEDIGKLFADPDSPWQPEDFAREAKKWSIFIQKKIDGKTIAQRALEISHRIKEVRLPSTNLQEYLDHMNEKGVFVSLYLDNGAVRGEVLDPKLNADPEGEEDLELTPEERRQLAYKKLFRRGEDQDAPIVQLASLVEEFQNPHEDFLPALSRWFSANGPRVIREATGYVLSAQVALGISDYSIESYLNLYLEQIGRKPQEKVDGEQFAQFVREAFQAPLYFGWNENRIFEINKEYFGLVNADLLRTSRLAFSIHELYSRTEVADFAKGIIPQKPLALNSAIKRFSNLHKGLEFKAENNTKTFEKMFMENWVNSAEQSLGESVVVDFVVKLAQTLFSQMAVDFQAKGITLSEWYFSSPYSNPGSTEALAGYAFKELDFLEKWKKHRAYLAGEFAEEVFPEENDRRAFRLLIDQVPNIWMYLKSGMARSGNDLTRAFNSKDRGYLIKNYVRILAEANRIGLIRDGVRLVEEYHQDFQPDLNPKEISDLLEERRKVSKGADALKRIMRSLFEPEREGIYESSTLGRILLPLSVLVSPEKQPTTERFLLSSAKEIQKADDRVLTDFFKNFLSDNSNSDELMKRQESRKALADLLRDPKFPIAVRQLGQFFQEDAVRPALNYLVRKIEDGSLQEILLFIRRVLGFRA
jgi:hypothetical protein